MRESRPPERSTVTGLGEELGEVARQADRLVGGLVDGAAEVGLVPAGELAGGAGYVVVDVRAGAPGAGAHMDRRPRRDLGRPADRGRVADEPAGGGEQRPAALVGLRLGAGEDRQRAQAVRPHPSLGAQGAVGGLQAPLVDPPRADEVVDDRQAPAGGAGPRRGLADPDHERRHQLGEALGALGERAAERQRRLGRAHLPHHPPPSRRSRGRRHRDPLPLRPRRPARAVVVAPQRQAVGVAQAGAKRRRLGKLGAVVGAHPPERRAHPLDRKRPLEGVGQPGLGDHVVGHRLPGA